MKKQSLVIFSFALFLSYSCKQSLSIYNRAAKSKELYTRVSHPITRVFSKNYKITGHRYEFWLFTKNYRKNFYNASRLKANFLKTDTFTYEVIKNHIYKNTDPGSERTYYDGNTIYRISLGTTEKHTSIILEERLEGKINFYNLGIYSTNTSITFKDLGQEFRVYQLKANVMAWIVNYINNRNSINKAFTNKLFIGFNTKDSKPGTRTLYLIEMDSASTNSVVSDSIGSSFFNPNNVKKSKSKDSTYYFEYDNKDKNLNDLPETPSTNAESSFLPGCKNCENKDDTASKFMVLGKKVNKDVIFDVAITKSFEGQYKISISRADTPTLTKTVLIDENYPSKYLDLIKKTGQDLWTEDSSNSFSHEITNRIQAALKTNFIKIKTANINDSLISMYDFDFGKSGVLALKRKLLPLYDFSSGIIIPGTYIDIKDVHIITDNNRISDISITGDLWENNTNSGPKEITNSEYSLSFHGLNLEEFSTSLNGSFNNRYKLNYHDLIYYRPTKQAFSYFVKNQEFSLCPAKKKNCFELDRRAIYDYLSLRVFLDPFGFLSKTPNGLGLIEGNVCLPSNIANKGQWTVLDQVTAKFDYLIAGSTNTNAVNERIIRGVRDVNNPTYGDNTINNIDNLDLFRKYTYKFDYYQSLVQVESKRLSQWIHLEVGFVAIGSRAILFNDSLKNNKVFAYDSSTVTLHKFIPAFRIKGDLRPDAIFGLNWSIGILYTGSLSRGNNNFNYPNNPTFTYRGTNERNLVGNYELNFYAILSKNSSGGLFFRHSGYLTRYDRGKLGFFPQILIGYATNINSLIKTVSKGNN